MRLDDERICYQLPKILDFHVLELILLAKTLHDLVATVVARSDEKLGARILDLLSLCPPVENSFFHVGAGPCATAGAAAEVVGAVGIHIDEMITALLGDPARLLIVSMAESAFALASIIARVMVRSELMMDRFIDFNAAFFQILLQEIMNADELDTFIGKPFLQTKPGRIVCVASFR